MLDPKNDEPVVVQLSFNEREQILTAAIVAAQTVAVKCPDMAKEAAAAVVNACLNAVQIIDQKPPGGSLMKLIGGVG